MISILKNILMLVVFVHTTANFAEEGQKTVASGDELVFCVTGDSRGSEDGINKKIALKIADAIKAEKPSFVFVNGDLVSGYSSDLEKQLINWRDTFMAPLLDAGIKVYSCRGNHDAAGGKIKRMLGKNDVLSIWQKVFSDKFAFPDNGPKGEKDVTYFVKENNVLVLVMDTYPGKPKHKVNLKWVKKVIQEEKGDKPMHLFAVTHEPAFAVRHKDCLASKPKDRDKFLDIFLSNGGICYFCGHDHFYNHAKVALPKGDFHQFVCGTLGAPLYKWKGKYKDKRVKEVKTSASFGYMVVRIKGKQATLTMKGWNNNGKLETIDTFSYSL